jgi:Holliday junction DNA helicase RuvB
MMEEDRLVAPQSNTFAGEEEVRLDRAIRPSSLADYIGQAAVREQMEIFMGAARARRAPGSHLDFWPAWIGQNYSGQYYRQ